MPPRSPSVKQVQAFDGRKSCIFQQRSLRFVTLFAQLWLNVFCLRSQNELKNFHSALQISQWSNVNLLWEFSLTYNGLNDILISSNGLYFIFYFICQSWHMLEMLSLEAGAFYVQVSYTNKLGGFKSPHSWASFKVIIFNFYRRLLLNDRRNQSGRKILELRSMN